MSSFEGSAEEQLPMLSSYDDHDSEPPPPPPPEDDDQPSSPPRILNDCHDLPCEDNSRQPSSDYDDLPLEMPPSADDEIDEAAVINEKPSGTISIPPHSIPTQFMEEDSENDNNTDEQDNNTPEPMPTHSEESFLEKHSPYDDDEGSFEQDDTSLVDNVIPPTQIRDSDENRTNSENNSYNVLMTAAGSINDSVDPKPDLPESSDDDDDGDEILGLLQISRTDERDEKQGPSSKTPRDLPSLFVDDDSTLPASLTPSSVFTSSPSQSDDDQYLLNKKTTPSALSALEPSSPKNDFDEFPQLLLANLPTKGNCDDDSKPKQKRFWVIYILLLLVLIVIVVIVVPIALTHSSPSVFSGIAAELPPPATPPSTTPALLPSEVSTTTFPHHKHECNISFLEISKDDDYTDIIEKNTFQTMIGNTDQYDNYINNMPECNKPLISEIDQGLTCCHTTLSSMIEAVTNAVNTIDLDEALTIPCGSCVIVDHYQGEVVDLPNGLRIDGMLYFPPSSNLTIKTTHVFVIGMLKIDVPNSGNQITFSLYGEDDVLFNSDEYSDDLPTCTKGCNLGSKPIAIIGGRLEIQAYPLTCPGWEKLQGVILEGGEDSKFSQKLVVSKESAECWGAGTELVLTSHTQYDGDRQLATVEEVDLVNGIIYLSRNISRPLTFSEHGDFGIEVASLNRPVVFEAENHQDDDLIGGHLIIFGTSTLQHLEGVEIRNFGQQGLLGRYPAHFHFCGDATGSVMKKNVVRQSNQRCYVIHQTDSVLIEDNVAFDTFGHCYFLEDGVEENNIFRDNLGLGVKNAERLLSHLSGKEETDDQSSVFWISNPMNYFYGNIAAGGESAGFWFETNGAARFMNLGAFDDNQAHSSARFGFTTYPLVWKPESEAVINNLKVYRILHSGLFLHNTRLLTFNGCVLADNRRSVNILKGDDIIFRDSKIIGRSSNLAPFFPGVLRGIVLHATKSARSDYTGTILGTTLENVVFENWSEEKQSRNEEISFAQSHMHTVSFYAPHLFRNVTLDKDGTRTIDVCPMESIGLDDIIIEVDSDPSGSFSPSFQPGFLVSPKFSNISDNDCIRHSDCLNYCERVCLRTLRMLTSLSATEYEMVVTDSTNDSELLRVNRATRDFVASEHYGPHEDGYHTVALPAGTFRFHFEDDIGAVAFPKYAIPVFEAAPKCGTFVDYDDVTIVLPDRANAGCSDLITNGSFENNITGWRWSGRRDMIWSSELKALDTNAIGRPPSQFLKVNCLEAGDMYNFSMVFNVFNQNGENLAIDCLSNKCMEIIVRLFFYERGSSSHYDVRVPTSIVESTKEGFDLNVSGIWNINNEQAQADKAQLILNPRRLSNSRFIIDDVQGILA